METAVAVPGLYRNQSAREEALAMATACKITVRPLGR